MQQGGVAPGDRLARVPGPLAQIVGGPVMVTGAAEALVYETASPAGWGGANGRWPSGRLDWHEAAGLVVGLEAVLTGGGGAEVPRTFGGLRPATLGAIDPGVPPGVGADPQRPGARPQGGRQALRRGYASGGGGVRS